MPNGQEAGWRKIFRLWDLRIGDVSHLPLGDGEADAMVMNMVLHHLPQPEAVFAELARVTDMVVN
jgi:ubiquinone/menaquinone biosynthesis C-methylase UbiE